MGRDWWGNTFMTFPAIDLDLAIVTLGDRVMAPVHVTGILNARLAACVW